MKKFFRKNKLLLLFALILVAGFGIYFLRQRKHPPPGTLGSPKVVTKVLDGDTVIVEGGHSVRLLGIDADERGYPCYQKAKKRLEELVLNKEVRLERDQEDKDQYQRFLRYLFLDQQNINLKLVEEGLAIARFSPQNEKYKEEIQKAENKAQEEKTGCKWSPEKVEKEEAKERVEFKWKELTPEATGLKVVGACNAGNYLGKKAMVQGKVADTHRSTKSQTVFLNFEKAYPNQCFTGVIFSSSLYKFVENPEDYYLGKTVRIRGKIKEYKGRSEIILEDPAQIEAGKSG